MPAERPLPEGAHFSYAEYVKRECETYTNLVDSSNKNVLLAKQKTRLRRFKGERLTDFAVELIKEVGEGPLISVRRNGPQVFSLLSLSTIDQPKLFAQYKSSLEAQQEQEQPLESVNALLTIGLHLIINDLKYNREVISLPNNFRDILDSANDVMVGKQGEAEIAETVSQLKSQMRQEEEMLPLVQKTAVISYILENPAQSTIQVSRRLRIPFASAEEIRAELLTSGDLSPQDRSASEINRIKRENEENVILQLLATHDNLRYEEIAEQTGINKSAVARRVRALYEKGLIDSDHKPVKKRKR